MSDIPPVPPQQPYNQPPQGQPYPPQGVPPQGFPQQQYGAPQGVPQGAPGGAYSLPGPKSNGLAVASLVVGILSFCIPFSGVVAAILGALGLGKAKKTHSGKGLALSGLILGILSLGMWVLFSGGIFALIKGTQVNRDVAGQFIRDLSAGNTTNAMANSDASSVKQEDLEAVAKLIQSVGKVEDVTTLSTSVVNQEATLAGIISFPNNVKKPFEMRQIKSGDQWKVTYFHLLDVESATKEAESATKTE